jgi:hypothetical protein
MGFRSITACILTIVIVSCSKQSQESTGSDSTGVAGQSTGTSDHSSSGTRTPLEFTPDQADMIADELFVFIHKAMVSDNTVALKEEFTVNRNSFKYTLIRHNLENFGLESSSYEGVRPPSEEDLAAYEADTTGEVPYPYGEGYTQTNYYYTSQIDTFTIYGDYNAYAEDSQSSTHAVTVWLENGGVLHKNAAEVGEDCVPVFRPNEYSYFNPLDGPDFLGQDYVDVDLAVPLVFKKEELYLKAKIKVLNDGDLTGLSKDELSFVRNDIFAHHGHTFKTPKMIEHYQLASWYHPIVPDAAALLNEFEKKNVDLIKKKEG